MKREVLRAYIEPEDHRRVIKLIIYKFKGKIINRFFLNIISLDNLRGLCFKLTISLIDHSKANMSLIDSRHCWAVLGPLLRLDGLRPSG